MKCDEGGFQIVPGIRANRELRDVPIMVLTANAGPEIERRVLKLKTDGDMVEPFDPSVLLVRFSVAFRRLRAVAWPRVSLRAVLARLLSP